LLGAGDESVLVPNVAWDDVSSEEQAMWVKRADRLQEGDWVVFDANTTEPKRLRIAWKAVKTQRIVFANVLGTKDLVLHLSELAKDLRTGSAVALSGVNEPAMDRAQYSMLQDLHQQLLHQSTHDQLTGLISRREFEKELNGALSSSKENKSRHALCFIDLDHFNIINNACGYEGGDQLLKEVSVLLSNQLEESWVLARLGSDEFGLLLKDCVLDDALDFTEELMEVIQDYRLQWDNKRLSIGFSMGLVPVSHRSDAANELLQAAESSCGVAKEMGGNRIQLYSSSHAGLSQRRKAMKWATEIDRILDEDTLYLRCQRIMPIDTGADASSGLKDHYEILLGVWDLNGGEISTPEFIEAAERYKRMPDVDRWVIKNAFRWITDNHQSLADRIDMFSINLSGRSLNDESFLGFLLEQIKNSGVPVNKITFEVTETTGVANISDAVDFIGTVKETGCLFSLDDFGTGMSSYAYLKNLPVDYLKIDGAFVKDMVNNPSDYAVAKSICEIGHFMGKKVIAEFVENDEILAMLKELGVDYAQGYGIEKPCMLTDLVKE
jgi:diguanylate cyclase (GGDEF)-like protein